jgi:hypothetical protein
MHLCFFSGEIKTLVQLRYSMPRKPAAEWRMQAADHKA